MTRVDIALLVDSIDKAITSSNTWKSNKHVPFIATVMRNADDSIPDNTFFTDAEITEVAFITFGKYQAYCDYTYKNWYDGMYEWMTKRIIPDVPPKRGDDTKNGVTDTKKSSKLPFLIGIGLVALLLLSDNKKAGSLSGITNRRSRRLFYISSNRVIPKSEVDTAKRMARQGYGKVYAVWAYNADEARKYIRQGKAETVSGLRGLGESYPEGYLEPFEAYEARMKAGITRDLSPTQEKQLLSYNATGDFEYGATNLRETMRVLEEKGYLKDVNRRYILTPKAKYYLDAHSHDIFSARFLSPPKYKKEMTLTEKRELQRELDKSNAMVKKAKLIPESKGQMTLFGGVGLGRIDNCYKYLSKGAPGFTEACFRGESTYGGGTATFSATDKAGRYIQGMSSSRIMSYDAFDKMMEKNKAKIVS